METAGVNIQNLSLAFGTTEVLKGVDLEIKPGEFFAFLGPSGSGKSTLLRAIAGFGPEPKGQILIGEKDVAPLAPWNRDVGMVFQSYALWPHMTVGQNVAFGLEERKVPRDQIKQRVAEALELVGLSEYIERRPSQLSGGQQQRVALARTIIVRPKVLLLDEPLSNLDANLRVQMRHELLALQKKLKLTTIFVTHDQEEANTMASRMAVLNYGVIQQVGAPMDLYDNPANKFVASFLGSANILYGEVKKSGRSVVFTSKHDTVVPLSEGKPGPAHLVIRPQNVSVVSASSKAAAKKTALQGVIETAEFLGESIRYYVAVGKNEKILVDEGHRYGQRHFKTGEKVRLQIEHAELVNASHKG